VSVDSTITDEVWDVTVVGAGPVGLTLALLLAAQGHRALVLEKHDRPYGLPRAVHFTPDISRLLDQLGVMDAVNEFAHEARTYDWQNAARETLISFGPTGDEKQGWPWSTMFNQPGLEKQLLAKVEAHPNVSLVWSAEVTSVSQIPNEVTLGVSIAGTPQSVTSRFAVGCDGAKSFVRDQIRTTVNDLGFFYDWLVIDIVEHEPRVWEPECLQICDPVRPVSVVSGGPGKRRFEFMRTETDGPDFVSEHSCWDLMAPWDVTPQNTTLERFRL
jgi:flavoprotein hydroxylase